MPSRGPSDRLARLERILVSPDRFVSTLLQVQTTEGEVVLTVGGCWDRHLKQYVDRPVDPHVVQLQASQVDIGYALADYLRARLAGDNSRPLILFGGGKRGGGKTWVLGGLAEVVLALAVPGCWLIGVNVTAKQRREVLDAINKIAPPHWITADVDDFRDPRTQFVTGSTIQWLSAKNPAALRQAGLPIEAVFINEAQDQPVSVFTNAVYAIRNTGGCLLIASNPPRGEAGDWTAVLWQGIQSGEIDGQFFDLDAAKNLAIHQPSLPKIAKALRAVDGLAADADAEGLWRLSGDLAYPGFSPSPRERGGHVGDPPDSWTDVTRELTASAVNGEVGFDYVAGADFQRTPGSCASIGKLYRAEKDVLVLWICEFVATQGVEEDLSQALVSRGYHPGQVDHDHRPVASALLVGDATGARQNAEHRKRDPYSFTRLRADGWTIIPPLYHFKNRTPMNPLVRDSRAQMHAVFTGKQILFAQRCSEPQPGFPSLIDSFRRAKARPDGGLDKKGHFQHGPDGVRYLSWRFLPRPKPPQPTGMDLSEVINMFRGIKLFTSE